MVIPWLLSMAIGFGFTLWAYGLACGMSHWPIHGILLWVGHWAFAHLHSMELLLVLLIVSSMESALWVAHWDVPHGHPMALLWEFSMVIPWLLLMAIGFGFTLWAYGLACEMSHWPFHSILLWVRHWAVCPSAFYGIALVHLIVTSMESVLWVAHWDDPTMGIPRHCFGSSQW